ncbi:hypothetical protein MTO96_028153 [Rhipicephalus appendiculatus]
MAVLVVRLVGNCLVYGAVYRNQTMHTVANYFIVNLAVTNFLVIWTAYLRWCSEFHGLCWEECWPQAIKATNVAHGVLTRVEIESMQKPDRPTGIRALKGNIDSGGGGLTMTLGTSVYSASGWYRGIVSGIRNIASRRCLFITREFELSR